ncbi:MAG: hypothetical protein NTX64_17530 [Elusimicrobia bacterium]|nr:hypothetical protein [Elusimicrobiota bacterium]
MKYHLFEFHSAKKKVKCLCGWERTLKTNNLALAYQKFEAHRAEEKRP